MASNVSYNLAQWHQKFDIWNSQVELTKVAKCSSQHNQELQTFAFWKVLDLAEAKFDVWNRQNSYQPTWNWQELYNPVYSHVGYSLIHCYDIKTWIIEPASITEDNFAWNIFQDKFVQ